MMHATGFALAALAVVLAVDHAAAVCPAGQMAVGREQISEIQTDNWIQYYSGFLMANNCGIISQNGVTENYNQMCSGGYNSGAAVYCSGGNPTQAVDTVGAWWSCYPTSDSSCNKDVGIEAFQVVACCTRA